jgi:spore maturation protein CgeB
LLAPYDHVFFKDALLVERVNSQLDLPVSLLPEACNPAWHRPSTAEPGDAPGIVVVGNMYPSRVRLLERLVAADVKLRLYGSNFPRWMHGTGLEPMHTGQVVSRRDKARVFREATAVLNNLHPAEMNSVNARLFEAAGSGGVVLCERRPILDDLFDDGTEVIGFTHFEELLEAIHALHTGKMVGRVFGDAATARAHSEHTYAHRCRTMFDALGLTRVVPADSSVTDVTAR